MLPPAGPSHLTSSRPGEAKSRSDEAPRCPKQNCSPNQKTAASAGACDLIKSVADELAPRYADLYLLESVEAAVGIATDRLREEIGAAVFKAQARVILDRIRYCYRGNRAADARRHLQQARWRSRAEHARSHGRPRGRYSLLHRRP